MLYNQVKYDDCPKKESIEIFTDMELSLLQENFPYCIIRRAKYKTIESYIKCLSICINPDRILLVLFKGFDEWYYVDCFRSFIYFKCDQMDGLLEFIKDFKTKDKGVLKCLKDIL